MGVGFFRVAAIMLFIVFWFVEILGSGSTTPTATSTATTTTKGSFKHLQAMERDGPAFHPDLLDSNYMSKRRVPNGPDPIHNRKAGKLRQPPGRA